MSTTALRPAPESAPPRTPLQRVRRRWALAVVIVLVLAVFATWLVAFSPVLGVRTVQVHGERTLRADAVEQAADVDYGQPLVRVDTAAIAGRIETLPQVESARVTTSFPATLDVTVTERTPVGYVMLAGRRMLVDRHGEQYLGVDSAPDLPKLVVPSGTDRHTTGGAVATVASALPAALRARTKSIEALDKTAITLVLDAKGGDLIVRWGSATHSGLKAKIVDVLRERKHVGLIDVTDPQQPFTRTD